MRTLKINLPDDILISIDKEAKEIGFDNAQQYIEHRLVGREVEKKMDEIQNEQDVAEMIIHDDKNKERRQYREDEFLNQVNVLCSVIKEQFPNINIENKA